MKAELTVININGAAEYLKFIAEIVKALAWPVVVLLLAARFDTAIQNFAAELAKRVKQLTGPGGISADFDVGKAVEELQADTERAQPGPPPAGGDDEEELIAVGTVQLPRPQNNADVMAQLVKNASMSAGDLDAHVMVLVISSWEAIETALRRAWAPYESWKSGSSPSPITMLSDLVARGRLSETTAGLISRAYDIRNKVFHEREANMTRADGLAYYDTALKIVRILEKQ